MMSRHVSFIFNLVLLASGTGCNLHVDKNIPTQNEPVLENNAKISYAQVREKIFAPRCTHCHGISGGVNLETYQSVKANLARIERVALIERSMPQARPLSTGESSMLRAWIDSGAPEVVTSTSPTPSPTITPEIPLKPNFASIKKRIFENRCLSCHSVNGSASAVPLSQLKDLLDSPRDLLLPGNVEESGLYIAITRNDSKRMPPGSSGLSDNEISVIREWITLGAPESEGGPPSQTAGGGNNEPVDSSQLSYAIVQKRIFEPRCISCHGNSGGINLETYLATKGALGPIAIAVLIEKRMPPGRSLKPADEKLLSDWIKIGAPENALNSQPIEVIQPTYSSISRQIFETKCMSCHAEGGSTHQVPLLPWKALLTSPRDLVLPGNSEESGLTIAITRTDAKRMPPASSGAQALSSTEIVAIRKWIDLGAKEVESLPIPLPSPSATPSPSPSMVMPTPSPHPSSAVNE